MKFLSDSDFDGAITAASKIRGATSYVMLAVGVANGAYSSGAMEAYTPPGAYAAGARPGYGFHAAGSFGTYLYAQTSAELRLRTDSGSDYTLWHSGNSRSDAQNDTRYSQLGHTHSISEISGLQAALDAKPGGTGTAGKFVKFSGPGTLADSTMTENSTGVRLPGFFQSNDISDTNARGFQVMTNDVGRWNHGKVGVESGANSGSDYAFWRLDDNGSYLGEVLKMSRATGNATFSGTITASGGNSTNWNTAFSWGNHAGMYVPTSRTVSAGTGLTGGGALSANISLAFDTTYGDGRYAALSHTHSIANVTGLQGALDAKLTGNGTAGRVVQYTGTNTVGDSILSISAPNVTAIQGQFVSDIAPASGPRGLALQNGTVRWVIGKFLAETGSNAGSDLVYQRYSDTGVSLGTAMTIVRATGDVTFSGNMNVSGGNSTQWNTAYGWGNHASAGYVPTSRTITINGTTFDLSANRSWTVSGGIGGSGTNGFLSKWSGSNLSTSSIDDSDANYLSTVKGFRFAKASGSWYFTGESNTSSANLIFTNPSDVPKMLIAGSNTGLDVLIPGVGYIASFLINRNFQVHSQIESVIGSGTAPFSIISTTMSPNLNADMVDGLHASSFALASSLSGYVPTTRTITINGTSFDLSSNRSWTIAAGIGGSGTAGRVPQFATSTTLTDSILSISAPNVTALQGQFVSDIAPASGPRGIALQNGTVRWVIGKFGNETGSNAGSDLVYQRYSDAGASLGTVMTISRATGNTTFNGSVTGAGFFAGGYNDSNWTQAYLWGNHGSAGYVTLSYLTTNYYDKTSVNNMVAGYVPDSRLVLGGGSIQGGNNLANNVTLSLYGDQSNPGVNKYYGTDGSGGKGWYNLPSGGGVPTSRVLTINGVSYDLSMDRSWSISTGGVSGSGSTNYVPMWNGSTSLTNSLFEYVGGVLMRMNGNLEISNYLLVRRCTQSERLSMGYAQGGLVYQTDGTEGFYANKSSGWVFIG